MPQKLSVFLKNALKAAIPLTIGILIFLWVYREMDFEGIWLVLTQEVSFFWLFLSLLFVALGHIIRGIRWKYLITPLGISPRNNNLIYSVFATYLINLILPRMGEISRCAIISKYESISFTKILGTLISERMIDILTLGFLIVFTFFINLSTLNSFIKYETSLVTTLIDIFSSLWLYVGIIITLIVILIFYIFFKEKPLMQKINGILHNLWDGIRTIMHLKNRTAFTSHTFLMWLVYFLEFYVCFFAFPFTSNLSALQALFIFIMANIAIIVPVQGGIGPWHFMVIQCLILFGVNQTEAAAFALVVHGIQMLMTILLGIFGLIALPVSNKKVIKKIT
ncbi:MAG: flippase-like domain-containing protein [Candidatus Azobacteroides sp.]|nr:flippase-like domain-containing protein [Candidatus Azobacteroides sp.]